MTGWLGAVAAILGKELLIEWRTRSMVLAMSAFGILVLFVFHFAFPPERRDLIGVAPGVLWVSFLFANLLGLTRTMAREREQGCLEAQLIAPVDRMALFVGKATANLLMLLTVEVLMIGAFALFFGLALGPVLPELAAVVLLGSVGLVSLGTLLSAMAVETAMAEILLTLMMTPLVLPVIIGAVKATGALLLGDAAQWVFWMKLMGGADAVYIILATSLFGQVVDR